MHERDPAQDTARLIYDAFISYQTQFRIITRRARSRFENRDWLAMQEDAVERLDLYGEVLRPLLASIRERLGEWAYHKPVWGQMKAEYFDFIRDRVDRELGETFFNSVTRRIFSTVGVDAEVEFVITDFENPVPGEDAPVYRRYSGVVLEADVIERLITDFWFIAKFGNLPRDCERAARVIQQSLEDEDLPQTADHLDMIPSVFFRGKGAYLIGRILADNRAIPLVLCLLHTPAGIVLDAALLTEDEVSILFSFTRSYFHVQTDHPRSLVSFLKSIMPRKPVSELYTSIGHNKHGKTELYRDLLRHLAVTTDQFEIAPGSRGMVMTVFTLPSYEVVFKIIKDRFDHPKKTMRREVMEKYRLVFQHDRAGRLVDAQEFEHLRFERSRFSGVLLEELQRTAAGSVTLDEQSVTIKHLYTERRLTPLDVYFRDTDADAVRAAVLDLGRAIKDMARANIFPGDVLIKNFGVTRHGRVVFYDYDEVCLLTDCNFRRIPAASDDDDAMSAEPWFYVAENDYFPEEFRIFFGLPERWRPAFQKDHADLFDVDFWHRIQDRIRNGEVIHIFPYPRIKHLSPAFETER